MKIYTNTNNNSFNRINFGYNKEYHKRVKNYLKAQKDNRQIARGMLKQDNFCSEPRIK